MHANGHTVARRGRELVHRPRDLDPASTWHQCRRPPGWSCGRFGCGDPRRDCRPGGNSCRTDAAPSERKDAELIRQKVALASTLLASLSHDSRTANTAITVAVENLQKAQLPAEQRQEQASLALFELERLKRLFRDILDMARIDAAALTVERDWVTPRPRRCRRVEPWPTFDTRLLEIDADASTVGAPWILAPDLGCALASNRKRARYCGLTPLLGSRASVSPEGLQLRSGSWPRPRSDGVGSSLERFFQGRAAEQKTLGSGMGLSITRGLLAAEGGRVWGENAIGGGAQFTLSIPSGSHAVMTEQDA